MIQLTEKSCRIMKEICDEVQQMDKKLYSCMEEDERKKLAEYLERLLERLAEL